MELDPNDPRPPYQQVAGALRTAVLDGTFAAGDRLPSGKELAERYRVARVTVQHALRELRDEGLVVSRQGSGVFVTDRTRERQPASESPDNRADDAGGPSTDVLGLRPYVDSAFRSAHVNVDFAGFSGETLHGVLQEPLDRIRAGRLTVDTLRVRILLPDTSVPMALPCDMESLQDDPGFRERAAVITMRHASAVADAVGELAELGVVKDASVEIRTHRCTPLFKLYLLNEHTAFFGFYPVREHHLKIDGTDHSVYDLMGKDATLFRHEATAEANAPGSQYVQQAREWFESMWMTVSRPAAR